ncbi:MAG: LPS export ABC transporter periplasmic protein LptC [Nitrospiraceae bacterium]|nr:LPS export ABC transporter periplasmic protein LptC [Nitrospiraceae bacterium]
MKSLGSVRYLRVILAIMAVLVLGVVWGKAVFAASPGPSSGTTSSDKVVILADRIRLNKKTNLLHANGHAFISKSPWTLRADSLILNKKTSIVWGAGHVVFKGPRTTMKGERIRANLLTGEAVLYHGKVKTNQFYRMNNTQVLYTYHIHGEEIHRKDPTHYHVEKGSVTTCTCGKNESPSWDISTNSGDMTLGDSFAGSGNTLDIKGIPALYMPYFSFPVASKKTGFLFPFLQVNTVQGLVFYDSFFWNIDPSYDLTVSFDDMSNFGIGEGITYRQAMSDHQNLSINITNQAIDYQALGLRTNIASTTDLYSYNTDNFSIMGNINYVNAQDFYQLMSVGSTMSFNPQLLSSVFVNAYQDNSEINLIADYNEDIFPGLNTTVSKLPQGSASVYDYDLGSSGLYFSSFLSGADIESGPLLFQRGLIYPHVSGSYVLGDGALVLTPHAGVVTTAYSQGYQTATPYDQVVPNAGIGAQSTIERDFQMAGGGTLTHQVQLDADFDWAPQNNETQIIQSGFSDNILGMNAVTLALTQRLFYSGAGGSKELVSLKLADTYDYQIIRSSPQEMFFGGQSLLNPFLPIQTPYSPIYGSIHVLSGQPVSFFAEGFYDFTQKALMTEDSAISFNQAAIYPAPVMLNAMLAQTVAHAGNIPLMGNFFNPYEITETYNQPFGTNFIVPYLGITTQMGLYLGGAYYYDLGQGPGSGAQMESFNFGYNGQCWSGAFMYYIVNEPAPLPVQTGFGFTVSLNGVAALAPIMNVISPPVVP